MRRVYLIGILLISACSHFDTRTNQKKAEDLAKHYLDSALNGQGDYKIISIGKIDTVSISNEKNKTLVKGWSVPVTYQGNNVFGIYERHKVQLSIDTGFTKVILVK
ncbi:hypothetical protein ACPPVU_06140 [Mucilaginibacter sp. McL0603]|uniref:hypothetical protein n=1 Tax=Mucilaginibacter sp. McL0603 TaxID=3415670 RepID=UPI003CF06FF6